MALIFERVYPGSLDMLVESSVPGEAFEAWTFDDARRRRTAEKQLARRGVIARIRSAYKPLLSAFREDIDLSGVAAIEIRYPVHRRAPANRFRLEAYPLAALVGDATLAFLPRDDGAFRYDVTLTRGGRVEVLSVLAPNRIHVDASGRTGISPTGWIRRAGETAGRRIETDYERLFGDVIDAVAAHAWDRAEPFFEELSIHVGHPAEDEPLGFADEVLSLREALHEDLYFSLRDVFEARTGRPAGDRGLRPGQIVPSIVQSPGAVSVVVETQPFPAVVTDRPDIPDWPLETAQAPLGDAQIARRLQALGGQRFTARSRAGRSVEARYVAGSDAAVMISAGQHANETTGIVGALRAAERLVQMANVHVTISPLENPDGYALHQRLSADNPRHMHHAARYTALGDDLEYRSREDPHLREKAIRLQAAALSGALLHVNLHGYPAHEWTRPLSGYIPRDFERWTLPKGFFLILRHHPSWVGEAHAFLDRLTADLARLPGLIAFNDAQIALYRIHAGDTGFRMVNGMACLVSPDDRQDVPMTLVTEYPDETIYGARFVTGHTVQMQTVLSAYAAWQAVMRDGRPPAV
jgi:hypothetical protein